MSKFFRKEVVSLKPYVFWKISTDTCIKLNANESNYGLPSKIQESISEILRSTDLSKYSILDPNKTSQLFENYIWYGIENVIIDNGSSAIIKWIMSAVLEPGERVLTFGPTFTLYKNIAEGIWTDYSELPFQDKKYLPSIQEISEWKPKLIIVCNPNNPTGHIIEKKDIKELVSKNPHSLILVDEAYIDFWWESSIDLIEQFDNLIVSRTFSKAYSMAGARLWYAVSNKNIISNLKKLQLPYNLNTFAITSLYTLLENMNVYKEQIEEILEVREYTRRQLEWMWFEVGGSHANFLLIQYKSNNISAEDIANQLEKQNILVRHFKGSPDIDNYMRVTIGTREQMDDFLNTLKSIIT